MVMPVLLHQCSWLPLLRLLECYAATCQCNVGLLLYAMLPAYQELVGL